MFTKLGVERLRDYQTTKVWAEEQWQMSIDQAVEFHGLIDESGKKLFKRGTLWEQTPLHQYQYQLA